MTTRPGLRVSAYIVLLGGLFAVPARAADFLATSLEPADVQLAADAASSGDTVVLPAGDYTGTGYNVDNGYYAAVTLKAGVSLRGQGIAETVIRQTGGS